MKRVSWLSHALCGLLPLTFLGPTTASAADEGNPTPVYVIHNCDDDPVGTQVVFKFKEAVRRSSRFKTVPTYDDATFSVSFVCLEPSETEKGSWSHFAFTITFFNPNWRYDYLIANAVNRCGADRVAICADSILAGLDSKFDEVAAELKSAPAKE